jgi:multidrug efflux pump subunit AcrB
MKSLIKILLKNPVFVNMLMFIILVSGIVGAYSMTREMFPRFDQDTVSVSVGYSGVDPEEIEEAVCLKLEEAIDGIEGVKEIQTTAAEGSGSATVQVLEGYDVNDVYEDIKSAVDAISTFPDGVDRPIIKKVKFTGNVLSIIIWGDLPERQLKETARLLKTELLRLKGVSQASISGIREYEISVEVSEDKLRKYKLTFEDVSNAIKRNSYNYSLGNIRTEDEEFRLRAVGRKYHARDYNNIPVIATSDGIIITLSDIAVIKDTFEDSVMISRFNGKPAVALNVFKTEQEDTIYISDKVKEFLAQKEKELPRSINLTVIHDMADYIKGRLNMLVDNGIIGLILVFTCLWMFLDIRLSFWVTLGIPISLAGAMIIMYMAGCSINMLSLFGFIMVLGLIVDDAIVVGESIYNERGQGVNSHDAVINGTSVVALPVIAAVLTTLVAFLPLFAVSGVMGKFIRQIPIPVIAALSISLIESLIILPIHLRHLPLLDKAHPPAKFNYVGKLRMKISYGLDYFINRIYSPFLKKAIRWRYLMICIAVGVLIIVAGMVKNGIIKIIFVPRDDSNFIVAKVEMMPGTTIEETEKIALRILKAWRKVEIKYADKVSEGLQLSTGLFTLIGAATSHGMEGGGATKPSQLEITIDLVDSEYRQVISSEIISAWQKMTGPIAGALKTTFSERQRGVGGQPIAVRVKGENYENLLNAANELKGKIASYPGVYDENVEFEPGKREFEMTMKDSAYHHGLSLADISRHIRGGFYGEEALEVQKGRDNIKVKVRYPEKEGRNSVEYFKSQYIETPKGEMVPLTSIVDIKLKEGRSPTTRYDRQRVVEVVADLDQKVSNVREVVEDLQKNVFKEIENKYSVVCDVEGQEKERAEAMGGLYVGFPLALLGIYFIIASMFRSYIQPVVIMTTIPFGLVGGVIGHGLMGKPLSMLSMFGLVALAGIVVNDAIVLIEAVNDQIGEGVPLRIAVCQGGKRRFRAILLTTLTTCFGLLPLIMEKSFQAQFLIPMAISIAFGVLFATIITLILMPCQLLILSDCRRLWHRLWSQEWKSREELEPRSNRYIHEQMKD